MKIIEISSLPNGGHRNLNGTFTNIPDGWAVIPDDMETPNFPFGEVTAGDIDGVMTVTKWVAGEIPASASDFAIAKEYYPHLWDINRINALYEAGKLTEEEYKELTK